MRIHSLFRGAAFLCLIAPGSPAPARAADAAPAPVPVTAAPGAAAAGTGAAKLADGDFAIGPEYADAPELKVKEGVPRGAVKQFVMNSEDSQFYPGIAKRQPGVVPYKRKVWVYVPKQYVAGTAVPFIVAQDGGGYVKTLVPVLDTLIHEKRLPVMAAILIDSGGGDAQGSERGPGIRHRLRHLRRVRRDGGAPARRQGVGRHLHAPTPTAGRRWAAVPAVRPRSPWPGSAPTCTTAC